METKNLCKEKCDFNQNLIEPSRSFAQLCNMINELEKDSNIEIAECNQLAIDVKYDGNLERELEKYLEVSDRNFTEKYLFLKVKIDLLQDCIIAISFVNSII